jgi:putative PIN family toxin of toxin-antitoxin system
MPKKLPRVLLDTNVIISGLVYLNGNEHRILQLAERREILLILPEPILFETREILQRKFSGFEALLDIYLNDVEREFVNMERALQTIDRFADKLTDKKDALIVGSIVAATPEYFVSGDKILRSDLQKIHEINKGVKICTSKESLSKIYRQPEEKSTMNAGSVRFRKVAKAVHGQKKGHLDKALSEAMDKGTRCKEQNDIVAATLRYLDEGLDLGGLKYAHREESHER